MMPSRSLRALLSSHFEECLLTGLIVFSVLLVLTARIAATHGVNLGGGEWLRDQTALLIGALLGRLRAKGRD